MILALFENQNLLSLQYREGKTSSNNPNNSESGWETQNNELTLSQPWFDQPKTSRKLENVEGVRQQPVLNCPRTSLNRIWHKDLNLHPYRIQIVQALKTNDYAKRLQFTKEMLEKYPGFNFRMRDTYIWSAMLTSKIADTGVTPTRNWNTKTPYSQQKWLYGWHYQPGKSLVHIFMKIKETALSLAT